MAYALGAGGLFLVWANQMASQPALAARALGLSVLCGCERRDGPVEGRRGFGKTMSSSTEEKVCFKRDKGFLRNRATYEVS